MIATDAYPEGFFEWPEARRNAFFANEAHKFRNGQANGAAVHAGPSIAEAGPTPLVSPAIPPVPYPINALGDVLSEAARAIAAKVQCADAMAAQSVLAVASLAAQALADVRLPYGQTRPLSLFCVTIASSGDRKTSADSEAMAPVRMREKQLREVFRTACKGSCRCARGMAWPTPTNRTQEGGR
jgi:Protein of unknown function (DUF3987)